MVEDLLLQFDGFYPHTSIATLKTGQLIYTKEKLELLGQVNRLNPSAFTQIMGNVIVRKTEMMYY